MKITLLDTKTGERVKVDLDLSWHTVACGEWSCDCNRAYQFGQDVITEMDAEMRKKHPELKGWQDRCDGGNRFLVVEASACSPGDVGFPRSLLDLNSEYPLELLKEHGLVETETHLSSSSVSNMKDVK